VRRHRLAVLALLVASVCASPRHAAADDIVHVVKAGDSLDLLAAEYYGDRTHQIFIMVANGMSHPRALTTGERLKVPASREVTADVGDTLEALAKAHLGDARRGRFLAEFNGLPESGALAAGQVVALPLQLRHTAAQPEKLTEIAAAYYGKASGAALLAQYNFLRRDALKAGESLIVPIQHVRVRASRLPPPDEAAQQRARKRQQATALAADALPTARVAWRRGAYGEVKRALAALELDFLDAAAATEAGVLLGGAYVATGDVDSALATFRRVLERTPTHRLEAYTFSPKIRAVWQQAGGAVAE
jgi:LysM repeat protein